MSLLVIGGIALDITATVGKTVGTSILHTSTPGHVTQSLGGVGRNVAEAAWRTGAKNVKLVSVVGDDLAGESVKQGMKAIGMTTEYIQTLKDQPTAVTIQPSVYNALHSNDGQLVAAVADMNIFDSLDASTVTSVMQSERPDFVCFDGNITSTLMESIATTCASLSIPALFEPTSVPKSLKLFQRSKTMQARSVQYTTPNQFELEAMCDQIRSDPSLKVGRVDTSLLNQLKNVPRSVETVAPYAIFLSQYIPNILTKLGEEGCLFVSKNAVIEYFSPEFIQEHEIKSVTGAGDCFVGTLIANLQKRGNKPLSGEILKSIIQKSQLSSIRTLKSDNAVSKQITTDLLV
ncbi:Ribokinase-like protein [Blakeslea trispora]|nr:Ribokinase-like protein [Blakeslea trispora]